MIGSPGDELLDDREENGADLPDDLTRQSCPWCGEPVTLLLDPGSGTSQEYVEDCEVCCRPWRVRVSYQSDGSAEVTLEADR